MNYFLQVCDLLKTGQAGYMVCPVFAFRKTCFYSSFFAIAAAVVAFASA